ncbi:MAG TPA: endonuclease III, partial [Pseudolabrys sp.]
MAKKATRKAAAPTSAARRAKAAKGKAKVKPEKQRAKADVKAAHGVLPQWKPAEIEEAFRRFQAANPEPKGELQHVNAFTLLVAVVLSAQATDAGV